MGGGLLQLVAYGAQDVYLTGNPQITFFKAVYRRHTNFAIEAIQQTFNGTPGFGQRVTTTVARNGDLIHRVYLALDLNGMEESSKVCKYFGLRLINYVEIEIGGQKIDKQYSHWMYIWNELSLPKSKRAGYDDMVGAAGGAVSGLNKQLFVPLEFWFCRNVGLALPLIALQYHEVKLNMTYASKNEMVVNNDHAAHLELHDVGLWVDYIFLDTDERRRFAQLSHEYLIEQLQFNGADSIDASSTGAMKSVRMTFNHPCKELIWFVHPEKTDDDTIPHWNNFSKSTNNTYSDATNPVAMAKIQLNGNDRFAEREGTYFSSVQPYQHHECTPDKYHPGINVYSFALKPEEHQPSGTLNMSRIDTAILSMSSTIAGNVSVFSVNYNVLRILSGMGGLAYSN